MNLATTQCNSGMVFPFTVTGLAVALNGEMPLPTSSALPTTSSISDVTIALIYHATIVGTLSVVISPKRARISS